jgi:hypothetical protein
MSITIHIPRSEKAEGEDQDAADEMVENISVNIPKQSIAKANDLCNFKNSFCSPKYSVSGDEINSNISFDSNFFRRGIIFTNYLTNEREIDIEVPEDKILQKNTSYCKNFYVNNETNNNFSSERVLCEELNNAHEKITQNKK